MHEFMADDDDINVNNRTANSQQYCEQKIAQEFSTVRAPDDFRELTTISDDDFKCKLPQR